MADVTQLLLHHYHRLGRQERLVADFVLANRDELATHSSVELASHCAVSKATVSRLFKRLGYTSYREVKEEVRQRRRIGWPVTSSAQAEDARNLDRHFAQEMANLTIAIKSLESLDVDRLLTALTNARRILVIGHRNSYPLALHCRQQFLQVRGGIEILPQPGQTISEEVVDAGPDDVVLLLGFRRRTSGFSRLHDWLVSRRVQICLLAEPTADISREGIQWWLPVPLDSSSAFDSYAAAMSVINYLANGLMYSHLASGRERIQYLSDAYKALSELSKESV